MKAYLILIITLFSLSRLPGLVAFNGFNGRNHPELKWEYIQTKNCQIIYHDPLQPAAVLTADIAQNTFDTLVKTYQTTPDKKCIIYISDQDNISNGAAMLSHYIFIWVNQNDFTALFTGRDKWIRKVVAHEISHWFVAASIEGWLTRLVPVFPSFPRNLNEGYAQFFSGEVWGLNRGDTFLKASILSDKSGIPSPEYEGGLLYADGFAKVRYLAAMYGEDSLIQLLKYRNKAKFYSFQEAFKKVYKFDYSEFDEQWKRYVSTYYFGEVYAAKAASADTSASGSINDFQKLDTGYYQFSNADWKGDFILFSARKNQHQLYQDLILAEVKTDSLKLDKLKLNNPKSIFRTGRFTRFSISENGKWAAFATYSRHKKGRLAPRLYRYDVRQQKLSRLQEGNYPEADSCGGVYYQRYGKDGNEIRYLPLSQEEQTIYQTFFDAQISNLSLSPDNQKLAFCVFDEQKNFQIRILDLESQQLIKTLELPAMPQSLRWHSADQIIYTVENSTNYQLEIRLYSVSKGTEQQLSSPAYNSTPLRYLDNKLYVMADWNRGAKVPGSFTPGLVQPQAKAFSENYYNKWLRIAPRYSIPDSTDQAQIYLPHSYNSLKNIRWRAGFALPTYNYLTGGFMMSEALGKHLLGGFAAIPYDQNKAWWAMFYENKTLSPTLDLMYSRQQWLSGVGEDRLYYQNMDKVSGKISFPINLIRPYQSADIAFNLSYTDLSNANANPIFNDKGFASLGAKTGFTYNLPWENSDLHPVRSCDLSYKLQLAAKQIGMNSDFNQHSWVGGFAYAPLLTKIDNEILGTLTWQNRSNYEFVNGDQLPQYLPGINQYDILQSGNRPAFKRYYLRGYEENYLSRSILNVQNELNIKLFNDAGVNILNDLLAFQYTGVAIWHDYTELHDVLDSPVKNRSYTAIGCELRLQTNLLLLPVILKYGIAYDLELTRLPEYFLIEIPMLQMIQESL